MNGGDFGYPLIPVAGEIESVTRGVVTAAAGVYDYVLDADLETINKRLSDDVTTIKDTMLAEEYNNIKVECRSSKSSFYKWFPTTIKITGSTNATSDNVSKIYVMDSEVDNVVENLASAENANSVVYSFESGNVTKKFKCIAQYGDRYSKKSKTSSVLTVTARNPIFYGVSVISSEDLDNFTNQDAEVNATTFSDDQAVSENLYSKDTPTDTISGKSVSFTLNNSSRAWILTTDNKLGAKDGGFDFPLYRYSVLYNGVPYYLYVSKTTYSNGVHILVFNSNENYS